MPNRILLRKMPESILGEQAGGLQKYTFATIAGLLHSRISRRAVIDAGSGDGFLALLALRLGSPFAVLIDYDGDMLEKARIHLRANGFREGEQFAMIEADLQQSAEVASRVPRLNWETCLISSLGDNWPNYPGISNRTCLDLIPHLEGARKTVVTQALFSGYRAPFGPSGSPFRANVPDVDLDAARKHGFRQRSEIAFARFAETYLLDRDPALPPPYSSDGFYFLTINSLGISF
jgi:SAM-dependent methyltransferase